MLPAVELSVVAGESASGRGCAVRIASWLLDVDPSWHQETVDEGLVPFTARSGRELKHDAVLPPFQRRFY